MWWQSILVSFLAAVILHDLVPFSAYALADRILGRGLSALRTARTCRDAPLNYIRVPVLATGLLFLLFFPGIIEHGAPSYLRATGQTQGPFLQRWLLLTGAIFVASAVAYGVRLVAAVRRTSAQTVEVVSTQGASSSRRSVIGRWSKLVAPSLSATVCSG